MKTEEHRSREFVNILKNNYIADYKLFKQNLFSSLTQLGYPTETYDFAKLDIAVKNIKDRRPLNYIFLSICNYFLAKYDEVDKFITKLKIEYPSYGKGDLLIALYEILSIRPGKTILYDYSVNFSFTYTKPELNNYDIVYKKITANWKNQGIRYNKVNSIEYKNKSFYLAKLVNSIPIIHILGGHGNSNKGLALNFLNNRNNSRLEATEMKNIMDNMSDDKNTGLLLLGCNPDLYINNIKDPFKCKYLIYSDSTTDLNIYTFLNAFFIVFNFTYSHLMAYKAGRLSLSIKGINDEDYLLKIYDNTTKDWISFN